MKEAKKTICEIRNYHGSYSSTGQYVESDRWGANLERGPKYKALIFRCRDCGAEGTSYEMENRISEWRDAAQGKG